MKNWLARVLVKRSWIRAEQAQAQQVEAAAQTVKILSEVLNNDQRWTAAVIAAQAPRWAAEILHGPGAQPVVGNYAQAELVQRLEIYLRPTLLKAQHDRQAQALRLLERIHTALGARNPLIQEAWKQAVDKYGAWFYGQRDPIQECLERLRESPIVYVLGGGGVIRVDARSGRVVDGVGLVGIDQVDVQDFYVGCLCHRSSAGGGGGEMHPEQTLSECNEWISP